MFRKYKRKLFKVCEKAMIIFLKRKIKGSENKRKIFRKRKVHEFYKRDYKVHEFLIMTEYFSVIVTCFFCKEK